MDKELNVGIFKNLESEITFEIQDMSVNEDLFTMLCGDYHDIDEITIYKTKMVQNRRHKKKRINKNGQRGMNIKKKLNH